MLPLTKTICSIGIALREARPAWGALAGLCTFLSGCSPGHTGPQLIAESAPIFRGTGPRLALLVGISRYPQSGTPGSRPWHPLHAGRDVAALRNVLTKRYGFRESDILTIQDESATADGIRAAFRTHLLAQAQPGAVMIFQFSGHGQQVRDDNQDELDGLDETLVPADAIDQHESSGSRVNLRDDEVGNWLRELQARMRGPDGQVQGSINVFLDSCYSGTATRGDLIERGRAWNVELDGPLPSSGEKENERAQSFADQEGDYVLLSAARSDQTAKELAGGMGAFTQALVGALWRADAQTTYRGLQEDIVAQVQESVWNQSPQLEGKPDYLLFGGAAPSPQSYVRVESVRGVELTLAAGALQLVTVGSTYTLHRAGSVPLDETTRVGEAVVLSTAPERSTLRLLVDPAGRFPAETDLRAARALERIHNYKDRELRLLIADSSISSEILNEIRTLPLVSEKGVSPASYDVKLTQAAGHLELRRPESSCPVARVPLVAGQLKNATALLLARLVGEWRWRQLYGLRNRGSPVQATLRLVPVQGHLGTKGHLQSAPALRTDLAATSNLRLIEGELFTLELTNSTPHPLWVTVLGLDPNGAIQVLFPKAEQAGDGRIQPGTSQVSSDYVFQTERPLGMSLYKVIATREPVDFSGLVQTAGEIGRGALTSAARGLRLVELSMRAESLPLGVRPLAQLLIHATAGSQRTQDVGLPLASWGISEARVEVTAARGSRNADDCSNRREP